MFLDESVFEDSVTIFKEEKMPGKGSECTSLSSLTIDDDLPRVSVNQIKKKFDNFDLCLLWLD